ncbi:hypothetical protein TCE0_018f05104 [Talaromyces pinophilus]|jgi:hypothetical protein|uniref:Alpha-L-rhamnosidase C n=1 Tax=Talaromyces pinophilus TaxID=128442 RepID=A0A510NVB0_TALPI|nr:hypothetical protein TCE0_018f05104 [Talaromyces pinophilus]
MAQLEPPKSPTVAQRLRKASTSVRGVVVNYNPQPGMWAATRTAIAYAPTLGELRHPVNGGENMVYNAHGHGARSTPYADPDYPALTTTEIKAPAVLERRDTIIESTTLVDEPATSPGEREEARVSSEEKHNRKETFCHALAVGWKFVRTPKGFLMTIYGLNIVAWGAMLCFLLLDAAPVMDHPNKDSNDSPRKKWIEIDSQILNALFYVTGFGLAPWRFRDLYWMIQARLKQNQHAMMRLCKQNESWFRSPQWYHGVDLKGGQHEKQVTFTGEVTPPTRLWKLGFVVWMMVLNTLFQCALSGMMWGYNRLNRPIWAVGTFIGLGCGVSLLAGIMIWWEGRKVKKIEGPPVVKTEAE